MFLLTGRFSRNSGCEGGGNVVVDNICSFNTKFNDSKMIYNREQRQFTVLSLSFPFYKRLNQIPATLQTDHKRSQESFLLEFRIEMLNNNSTESQVRGVSELYEFKYKS